MIIIHFEKKKWTVVPLSPPLLNKEGSLGSSTSAFFAFILDMMNSIFIWEFLHAIYHLLLIMVKKGLKKTWLASYGRKYKQMSSQRNFSFESI